MKVQILCVSLAILLHAGAMPIQAVFLLMDIASQKSFLLSLVFGRSIESLEMRVLNTSDRQARGFLLQKIRSSACLDNNTLAHCRIKTHTRSSPESRKKAQKEAKKSSGKKRETIFSAPLPSLFLQSHRSHTSIETVCSQLQKKRHRDKTSRQRIERYRSTEAALGGEDRQLKIASMTKRNQLIVSYAYSLDSVSSQVKLPSSEALYLAVYLSSTRNREDPPVCTLPTTSLFHLNSNLFAREASTSFSSEERNLSYRSIYLRLSPKQPISLESIYIS